MEYLQDFAPIHKKGWDKLCFALIYGAFRDIIAFIQHPSYEAIQRQTAHLTYGKRRVKLKEYHRIKRRSEKACEWIDGGPPKKGSKGHVSFQEACEELYKNPTKVRENIKNIIRKMLERK